LSFRVRDQQGSEISRYRQSDDRDGRIIVRELGRALLRVPSRDGVQAERSVEKADESSKISLEEIKADVDA
jgi:hypothetical protein